MSMIDEEKVKRLRTETAHCSGVEGLPEEYQKVFAAHSPDSKCLYCGDRGSFTWGLCHGRGHCHNCGWPARFYHYPKDAEGNELPRVVLLLQYHPDDIILPSEKQSEQAAVE